MPPRTAHSKSRRGCFECKRRHTKCDERHPRCATCTRLGIDCTWPNWRPRNGLPSSPSLSDQVGTPGVSTPGLITSFNRISTSLRGNSAATEDLAIDDLKLLHHFATITYATLDSVVSQQHIWQQSVIQIGFKHQFLLRGILGISALHLATLNPDMSVNFIIQASSQYNCALLDFRKVLRDIREDTCVAVFAFSCITVLHAFAVARVQQPEDPIADFLNCMLLVQGVGAVLKPHYSTLMASELSPMLENGIKGGVAGEIPEILQLKELVSLLPEHDHGETADTYTQAVDLLHTVILEYQRAGENQSYMALLFSWPALLPPKFFSSLSIHEPVSLIIMTFFASILGHKKNFWWTSRWNTCILNEVESKLQLDLLEWLVWPRRMCEENAR